MKGIQRYETIYSYGNNSSTSGNLIIQTGSSNDGDTDRVYLMETASQVLAVDTKIQLGG